MGKFTKRLAAGGAAHHADEKQLAAQPAGMEHCSFIDSNSSHSPYFIGVSSY